MHAEIPKDLSRLWRDQRKKTISGRKRISLWSRFGFCAGPTLDTNLRSSEYQKKLRSSGSYAPRTPSQLRCSVWRCGGAQQVLGNRRQRRALGRAQTRAAKSCGVRGSHFPALFDCFNLSAIQYQPAGRSIFDLRGPFSFLRYLKYCR